MDAERFWDMSLGEVLSAIESFGRRSKLRQEETLAEAKLWAGLLHRHAQLVATATWAPKKYPALEEAFPGLWKRGDTVESVPLWKKQQAGMAAWVAAYNDRIRRGGV